MVATSRTSGRVSRRRLAALAAAVRSRLPGPGRPEAPAVLLGALLAVALGAALAGGAIAPGAAAGTTVAGLLVGLVAAAWLGGSRPELVPTGRAGVGLALLVALAAWALASTAWAVSPDRAWTLGGKLLLVAVCGVLAGAVARGLPRARERTATGLLVVGLLIVGLGLAERLAPGGTTAEITFAGLAEATRMRGPVGYWNAFGLVAAGVALLLARIAVDRGRSARERLVAGAVLGPVLAALVLAESRGALLALLVGAAVLAAGAGARLRVPALLLVATLAALPAALAGAGRLRDGAIVPVAGVPGFAVCLLLAAVAAAAAVRVLVVAEGRVRWTAARTRRALLTGLAVLLLVGVVGVVGATVRAGGPGPAVDGLVGAVADEDRAGPIAGQERLLSVSGSRRTDWWAEALGAWRARPVAGWGAGGFGVARLRYRDDQLEVLQPHSAPLQLMTELGLVGLVLGGGAALLLADAGRRRLREDPRGDPARGAGAVLLAVAAAWGAQALVDWDLDVPGVTVPAAIALAVAACAPRRAVLAGGLQDPLDPALARLRPGELPRPAGRLGATAAVALALSGLLAATVLVDLGRRRAEAALDVTGSARPDVRRDAVADAALAARLDPFGVRPLRVLAVAERVRERRVDARDAALRAVRRTPEDPAAWRLLATTSLELADRGGARVAAARMLRLDPTGVETIVLAAQVEAALAPPGASGTAVGTPLPTPGAPGLAADPGAGAGAGTAAAPEDAGAGVFGAPADVPPAP